MAAQKTRKRLLTAEDLLEMQLPEGRSELIDGELVVMGPEAWESGGYAGGAAIVIGSYVRSRRLGMILTGDPGFILQRNPDRVRCPDVAFISASRLPTQRTGRGFFQGAPDLVLEVVSPTDRAGEIHAKVLEWLAAGAKAVWVLYPDTRTVLLHQPGHEAVLLREDDTLTGEPVIPGFSVTVKELFE